MNSTKFIDIDKILKERKKNLNVLENTVFILYVYIYWQNLNSTSECCTWRYTTNNKKYRFQKFLALSIS